jgi:hypothetical protein
MVELELLNTLQSISYIAGATGVCIGAIYYIVTLRDTEKVRRRDMVFQKLQINMNQYFNILYDVLGMTDWNNLEEWASKYGRLNNPEAFSKIMYIISHYNALGILLKDGVVKSEEVFQLYLANVVYALYCMYEPWIMTQRINLAGEPVNPEALNGFEYLALEAKRMYPNLVSLREWPQGPSGSGGWGRAWDEFFRKNPQLIQHPFSQGSGK